MPLWSGLDPLTPLTLWGGLLWVCVPTGGRHCFLGPQAFFWFGERPPALQAWTRWRCDVASCGQQMVLLIQYCRLLVPRCWSFLIQPQSPYFSGISALLPARQPPARDSWRGWAISLPTQGSSAGEQAMDNGPLFWREEVPCSLWLQAEAGGVKSP